MVWNKSTKSIETKYTKKAEWSSDAMQFDELKIDTGLYYLNKSTRAFGVRYGYIVSSNDPYGSVAINLYYLKNNQIVEVLNNFELEMYSIMEKEEVIHVTLGTKPQKVYLFLVRNYQKNLMI